MTRFAVCHRRGRRKYRIRSFLRLTEAIQSGQTPEILLPVELPADLSNARIPRIVDNPKARIADVPGGIYELRMVEDIKEFETQIERESLIDRSSLQDSEIGVIEARTVEEASVGS